MTRFRLGIVAVAGLLTSMASAAEPFVIHLTVRSGKASKTVHAKSSAPLTRPKKREVLEVKAGERITVKWKLSRTDPGGMLKDITVHFFAVKEKKASQESVPKLDRDVVAESALSMDFGPGDKAEGELNFSIDKPSFYLLRLETIGATAVRGGHENFAALDVKAR